LDRQIGVELHPIDQAHALLLATGKLIIIIAFDHRGHRQQVLPVDGLLARIRVQHVFATSSREQIEDAGGSVGDVPIGDGHLGQHSRHSLGR
jgi:hypothetical protein